MIPYRRSSQAGAKHNSTCSLSHSSKPNPRKTTLRSGVYPRMKMVTGPNRIETFLFRCYRVFQRLSGGALGYVRTVSKRKSHV
jgi:hypothetical protein